MAKLDPSTGPIPRDQFQKIVNAPFGEATRSIRQYDPEWGRAPGEKFEWRVHLERTGEATGTAVVKAASKEEAQDLAAALSESEIDWDYDYDNMFTVVSVEPNKLR